MRRFVPVADAADIPAGACRSFQIGGSPVIVAHLADGFHAVLDRCSHADSPLDPSRIYKGGQIACPVHGARFDLRTGAARSAPAFRGLAVFPVRVAAGRIEIEIDDLPPGDMTPK
jgi:3-phenylpropionate/trans-cinnamate dioxygenase ferredoxin subunit